MKSYAFTLIALFSLLGFSRLDAQPLKPGEWRAMTSMRAVRDIAVSSDSSHAWAVTSGGAFRIDLRDTAQPVQTLRTTEGLASNDLTAVAADNHGHVFFGGASGSFDILDESTNKVRHVSDITNSDYSNKRINSLSVFGDRVYLSTAYGLSVYSTAGNGFFLASVTHFANLPTEDSVHQTVEYNGYIYAGLQEGIVFAQKNALLSDYLNWTFLPTSNPVLALQVFHNAVYAGASDSLLVVASDRKALSNLPLPQQATFLKLLASPDTLYVFSGQRTVFTSANAYNFQTQTLLSSIDTITAAAHGSNGSTVLSTASNGIALETSLFTLLGIYPNGPLNNTPSQITYSPSTGLLYVANAADGVGVFDPATTKWVNYAAGVGNTPRDRMIKVVHDSVRDVTWFSTFGTGLYQVKGLGVDPNPVWSLRNKANGLPSFGSDPGNTFMVPREGIIDRQGQYVVTSWAGTGEGLALTRDGNTFSRLKLNDPTGEGLPFGCVTQDLDGNYWVGTETHSKPQSIGVFWVRADGSAYGNVPGGPGQLIPSSAVNAILTDQDNEIWAGTEQGVHIISDPYQINTVTSPKFSVRDVKLVSQQVVHSMAVDGVGNKWIGTENGIFVVSPDGSDSVAHFSKENSPLIDNFIVSLAIDVQRGEAYAATLFGISRFSTIFKQGNPDYSSLRIYPNPVVESADESQTVFIDGLVSGSTVKIFTLRGELVAAINGQSLGSTVRWNGRDDQGHAVPSGMYLISTTSTQSGSNGQAKVVIVRKP